MKKLLRFIIFLIILLGSDFSGVLADDYSLTRGIEYYRQENYKEAIEHLLKAREQYSDSSAAAFSLGMAYKQLMDYPGAMPHLQDAATLVPRIRESLPELIFILRQIGKPDEAEKWIQVAEKENIFPAKIAFLKGMICSDQGKTGEAIRSFEAAKNLNPSFSQSAERPVSMTENHPVIFLELAQERLNDCCRLSVVGCRWSRAGRSVLSSRGSPYKREPAGDLSGQKSVMLGSCVPLILVLLLGIISLMSLKILLNTSHWVDHTIG